MRSVAAKPNQDVRSGKWPGKGSKFPQDKGHGISSDFGRNILDVSSDRIKNWSLRGGIRA